MKVSVCVAVWLVLAGGVVPFGAAEIALSEETEGASEAGRLSEKDIAEIMRIRRALGGPLSSIADRSVLSKSEPRGFRRALQAVKVAPLAHRVTVSPPRILGGVQPSPLPAPAYRAMRNAARQLDTTAADLEEIGSYDIADQLRRIAAALRKEARSLAAMHSTPRVENE